MSELKKNCFFTACDNMLKAELERKKKEANGRFGGTCSLHLHVLFLYNKNVRKEDRK
jgi:hypothetical protein